MEITAKKNDNHVMIWVEGRMDTTNYTEFENAVNEFLDDNIKWIMLDCSGLKYVSSSGLRIFLTVQKKMMSNGGALKLIAMQPAIKEIFDISGFSSIFSIYPDWETAKKSIQ